MLLDVGKQPSLIISFNAPSFASKLLCSLIFCNTLLQAEGRPRELGRSFRGWVHDSVDNVDRASTTSMSLPGGLYEWWDHMVATLAASAEDAEEELSGV